MIRSAANLLVFAFSFAIWHGCGGPEPVPGETAQPIGATTNEDGGTRVIKPAEAMMSNDALTVQGIPFTGIVEDNWDDGAKKYSCVYTDGKKNGPEQEWWPDGKKKSVKNHLNGTQDGLQQEWWPNEQVKSMTSFTAGLPHGEAKGWHDNGKLARKVTYENGVSVGVSEGWWKNGQPAEKINFLNGKPEGQKIKWYPNGQTNAVTFYQQGVQQGVSTTWHPNGKVKMILQFVNGKAEGQVREWHDNGQQLSVTTYQNGIEHGQFGGWWKDGTVAWSGTFNNGVRDKFYGEWHSNKIKRLEANYNSGLLQSRVQYNLQGQITERLLVPQGKATRWTEQSLDGMRGNRQSIQQLFGKPEAGSSANQWVYTQVPVVYQGKLTRQKIFVSFDATGNVSTCGVIAKTNPAGPTNNPENTPGYPGGGGPSGQ